MSLYPSGSIPLGDVYMVKILTIKELWTHYKLHGLSIILITETYSTWSTLQRTCKGTLPWFPGSKRFTMARSEPQKGSQWPGLSPYSRRQIPFIRNSTWSMNVGIRWSNLIPTFVRLWVVTLQNWLQLGWLVLEILSKRELEWRRVLKQ